MAPARGVQFRGSEVGCALGLCAHLLHQPFELAAPDILQVDAIRPTRRGFVEVHRHAEPLPDPLAELFGQPHTIFDAHTFHGHERHHVRRADARMHTLVLPQVDQLHRLRHRAKRRLRHLPGLARERNHAPVVIGVHFAIENRHAPHGKNGRGQRVHPGGVASFGKVRDALHNGLRHATISPLRMVVRTLLQPK